MLAVLAAVTATALFVGVSAAAAAKGGNSDSAKLCQKEGWRDLVGSDGQSFASEEECVSHAAQGGTVREPTPLDRWRAICEGAGGELTNAGPFQWECFRGAGDLSQATYDALATPCTEAGGTPGGFGPRGDTPPPYVRIHCNFS